ncbi:3-oxoacyl-(acyl carrier protein) synthase II [Ochrobactrum sp. CDB2]|nr:3-oxoacyl-(acyl carrier protein) synthase II [Ochrobactrum sp. CDB2]
MTKYTDHLGRPIVAITGAGVVSSLGQGKEDNWAALTGGVPEFIKSHASRPIISTRALRVLLIFCLKAKLVHRLFRKRLHGLPVKKPSPSPVFQ